MGDARPSWKRCAIPRISTASMRHSLSNSEVDVKLTIKTTLVTLFALGLILTDTAAQPSACGSEIETADVNGAALHYFECGEGESLVFVHGALGDLRTFSEQVETFAQEFRVIAYSRRYHPPNDPPQSGDIWTLQLHAADLAVLIDELEAGPAHIIGHSGGAYIALAFAIEHPELVRSLVLAEAPVLPLLSRTSVGDAMRDSWNTRVLNPVRDAFQSGALEEGVRRFMDAVIYPGWFDELPPQARENLVEKQGPTFRLYMLGEPSRTLPPIACETLGQLGRPTLLVTGEQSPAMLLLASAELERCLSSESHVMVPEAGHGMPSENPSFFNEAVRAFLHRR